MFLLTPLLSASFQYIMNHLNSVHLLHLYDGFACDALNGFSVSLTNKGLQRIMGTKSQQKHPITINILQRMGSVLDLAIPSQAVLWCLFLVAFFSFLRKSNLTTPCAQTFDPTKHLTQKDIKFSSQGAVLRIHWSKTLQHREGMLLIPLPTIAGSPLCLVTAIQHYFQLVPADPNSPYFCVPKGRYLHPITFAMFSSSLKTIIKIIGLEPRNYSPHSFRRGGATYAYQSGGT